MIKQDKIRELVEMCYYGHFDQVVNLVNEGIEINGIVKGYTALRAAREEGNTEIVEYLLSIRAQEMPTLSIKRPYYLSQ